MVELIGDVCEPSVLNIPQHTIAELDVISGLAVTNQHNVRSGLLVFNVDDGKLEVWTGIAFEVVTSVTAR